MKTIFYNKFFSRLSIALVISFLISRLSTLSKYSFSFALAFFAALYLLFGWFSYLRLDGVHFFRKRKNSSSFKIVDFRSWYKKKGVYNMDRDEDMEIPEDIPESKLVKITIYAYLSCSIILFIVSHISYNRI